ncbi:hypothetical protein AOLI_G00111250 [Acnodon oligacanthus]
MIIIWAIIFLLRIGMVQLQDATNATIQSVKLGDNVMIKCYVPQKSVTTKVWYKQSIGQSPRPVALSYNYLSNTKFVDEFQNGRFKASPKRGSFHLNITAVTQEDTGAYYCGIVFLNRLHFVSWTFLMPAGTETNLNNIKQPMLELVLPGDSVTLQCTVLTESCSGEHSVYWFRHGSGESHPGIIYTHGKSNGQCKKMTKTDTQSCVYKLPKRNLSLSDAGTHYCAVAMCGEILFGKRTALKIMDTGREDDWDPAVLGFACTNVLFVAVIVALVFDLYNNWRKKIKGATNNFTDQPHQALSPALQYTDDLNYCAVSFIPDHSTSRKARRTTSKDLSVYAKVSFKPKD